MCWSKNVSLAMAVIGSIFTYYSYTSIDKLWSFSIFYFTLMQLIHYIGYIYIDKCNNSINNLMSYLNYIHISFQPPVFILGFASLFYKLKVINNKDFNILKQFVYFAVLVSIFMLMRLFPLRLANVDFNLKKTGCVWCGDLCTYKGKYHVNFSLPLRNKPIYLTPTFFTHFALFYLPFLLLMKSKVNLIMLLIFVTSLIPAVLFHISPSETGTIWCGISILQFLVSFLFMAFSR